MNFTSQRIFQGFRRYHHLTINQFAKQEKVCLSINHANNVPSRLKMKLVNPGVFAVREKKRDWDDYNNEKMGIYGYALLGIPIVTFILGTWQIKRLQWKNGLIDNLYNRAHSEPIPLPDNLEDLKKEEFCPVRVRGTFIHDNELMMGPKSLIVDGQSATENRPGLISQNVGQGYWLITPFKLADRDLTILVNRGWVPSTYKSSENRKELKTEGVVDVVGLVRLHEDRPTFFVENQPERNMWIYRNLKQMAEQTGAAPVYIDQLVNNLHSKYPIGGQTRITLRNEHMTYAVTWYGISIVTALMWYRQFIRKAKFFL